MMEWSANLMTKPLRVLVCGSRTFGVVANDTPPELLEQERARAKAQRDLLYNKLYELCQERKLGTEQTDEFGNWMPNGLIIIQGGAKGADAVAADWAIVNWVPQEEYKADWNKYHRAAGPIRNKQMLDTGIDLVIAFPVGEARGTNHMIGIAKKAGVEVRIIHE
jgi:hypothetical protein